jgi:putative oxidoreductase
MALFKKSELSGQHYRTVSGKAGAPSELQRRRISQADRRIPMATLFNTTTSTSSNAGALPLIGRIAIAAIFVLSGLSKLAAPAATIGYIQSSGLPLPQVGYAIALLVELGGGIALVLGYRTRLVAAILAAFSIVTALAFHSALGDQSQFINFFKNVAMAGGLLNVVAFGGGAWSLDARR